MIKYKYNMKPQPEPPIQPVQNIQAAPVIQQADAYVTLAINAFQTHFRLDPIALQRVGEGDQNSFSYVLTDLLQRINNPNIENSITNKALTLQMLDAIRRMGEQINDVDPNQASKLYNLYSLTAYGLYNNGEGFTERDGWSREAFQYRNDELNRRLAGIQDQAMRDKITGDYYYNYTAHQELNRLSRRPKDKPNSEAQEVDNIFPKLGQNVRENVSELLQGYKLSSPDVLSLVLDPKNRLDPELAKYHLIADMISRIELLKGDERKETLTYLVTVHDLIDSGELIVANKKFKKVHDDFFNYPFGQRVKIVQNSIQIVLKKYGIDAFTTEEISSRRNLKEVFLNSFDLYDARIARSEKVVQFQDLDKFEKPENPLMRMLYAYRTIANVQGFKQSAKIWEKIVRRYEKARRSIRVDGVDIGPWARLPLIGPCLIAPALISRELVKAQKEINRGTNSTISPFLAAFAEIVYSELRMGDP